MGKEVITSLLILKISYVWNIAYCHCNKIRFYWNFFNIFSSNSNSNFFILYKRLNKSRIIFCLVRNYYGNIIWSLKSLKGTKRRNVNFMLEKLKEQNAIHKMWTVSFLYIDTQNISKLTLVNFNDSFDIKPLKFSII